MPRFSHLRSDYPLYLSLLERPYAGALKLSYRAGLPSARAITVPLIGSNCWCPWQFLVDRAFGAHHYSGSNCLNIDEQLVHLVEHWRARPGGNYGTHSYALTLSLFSPNSALYAVAAVLLAVHTGTSLADNHSFSVRLFKCRTRRKECTSGPSLLECLFRGQQGKSDQLRRST